MAKVTEQDLLNRGFKNYNRSGTFEIFFTNVVMGEIILFTDMENIELSNIGKNNNIIVINKPLTHANLDLFIRFAEGKEL